MRCFHRNRADHKGVLPGRPKSTRLISVIIVIFLIISFFIIPVKRMFVIVEKKSGKILYLSDVKPFDSYVITYTHSVNKSPVDDYFEIQNDFSILLKKTAFRAFGVGIPSEVGEGQKLNIYEDRIEIDNINMPVREHLLFVGVIADHIFSMNGQSIHLNKLTEPQQTLQFEVRRVPIGIIIGGNL